VSAPLAWWGALGLYFCFLVLGLWYRGPLVQGRAVFLLRSFFPNWRFYHRVTHRAILHVRYATTDGEWGPWQAWWPRSPLAWHRLLGNARGNALLARQTLVEHLSADLQRLDDPQAVARLVSYRLVARFARERALGLAVEQAEAQPVERFQFALRLAPPYGEPTEDTTVLCSPELRP
jgi:hypothetical protein